MTVSGGESLEAVGRYVDRKIGPGKKGGFDIQ